MMSIDNATQAKGLGMDGEQQAKIKDAMDRYYTVKLAVYRRRLAGEHEAQVAARFALDDAMAQFKSRTAREGFDSALAVHEMDIEDAQTALIQLQTG